MMTKAEKLFESGSGGPRLFVDDLLLNKAVDALMAICTNVTDSAGLKVYVGLNSDAVKPAIMLIVKNLLSSRVALRSEHPLEGNET